MLIFCTILLPKQTGTVGKNIQKNTFTPAFKCGFLLTANFIPKKGKR